MIAQTILEVIAHELKPHNISTELWVHKANILTCSYLDRTLGFYFRLCQIYLDGDVIQIRIDSSQKYVGTHKFLLHDPTCIDNVVNAVKQIVTRRCHHDSIKPTKIKV